MLDFEQSALDELVQPAVLVTVICETVLKESLVGFLNNLKVKGYSISEVQGEGRYAPVGGGEGETQVATRVATQVEIRAVVTKELADVIFYALKEQQHHFAITAYRQTVEALAEV